MANMRKAPARPGRWAARGYTTDGTTVTIPAAPPGRQMQGLLTITVPDAGEALKMAQNAVYMLPSVWLGAAFAVKVSIYIGNTKTQICLSKCIGIDGVLQLIGLFGDAVTIRWAKIQGERQHEEMEE